MSSIYNPNQIIKRSWQTPPQVTNDSPGAFNVPYLKKKETRSIHPITNSLQDCKPLKSYFAKERTKLEIIFQVTEAGISSELSFYVQLKYSSILKIWEVSLPLTSFPAKETYDRLIFRVID